MLYHSFDFAVFFAAVALAFYALPPRGRAPLLLSASYLFYSDFEVNALLILLGVTSVAYTGALAVARTRRKATLALSVGLVLATLGVFKYYEFAWGLVGMTAPRGWVPTLPIGISFYTLQAVSYLVDVSRGTVKAERSPIKVALYLAFFPQILAGPIERADRLLEQFGTMRRPPCVDVYTGVKVVLWGLFCKLVVADKLGLLVDSVFAEPGNQPGLGVVVAIYLYSFQIFFDFYGYTNVSLGLARMLGVRLSLNFDNPYLAVSIRDFWRRWHITLTTWFRDYVYIPLGGHALPHWRWAINVIVVFLLSGLWHGAAPNFVLWGGLHASYYLVGAASTEFRVHAARKLRLSARPQLLRAVQVAVTFHLVTLTWLVFRVPTLGEASALLYNVFRSSDGLWLHLGPTIGTTAGTIYMAFLAFALAMQLSGIAWSIATTRPNTSRSTIIEIVSVNIWTTSLILLGDIGTRAYIYFQF